MRGNTGDLHGMVPDKSPVALLLIDVINALEFPEADRLLRFAIPMAQRLAEFKRRVKQAGIPVVYVNDNYGRWQSNFTLLIDYCLQEDVPGKPIIELLQPEEDDYFVLKPKHSGFFSTTLGVLLDYLGTRGVILTGIAGNICILFTANDAYMRDLKLWVPSDCCASNEESDNRHALEQMQQVLKADIRPSTDLDPEQILRECEQLGQGGGHRPSGISRQG